MAYLTLTSNALPAIPATTSPSSTITITSTTYVSPEHSLSSTLTTTKTAVKPAQMTISIENGIKAIGSAGFAFAILLAAIVLPMLLSLIIYLTTKIEPCERPAACCSAHARGDGVPKTSVDTTETCESDADEWPKFAYDDDEDGSYGRSWK